MAEREQRNKTKIQPGQNTAQPLSIEEQQGLLLNALIENEALSESQHDRKKWLSTIRITLTHPEPIIVKAALELIQKSDPALGVVVATALLHRGHRLTHVGEEYLGYNVASQTPELREFGEIVGTLIYPPSETHTLLSLDHLGKNPLDEDSNKRFEATVYALLMQQQGLSPDILHAAALSLKNLGAIGEDAVVVSKIDPLENFQ